MPGHQRNDDQSPRSRPKRKPPREWVVVEHRCVKRACVCYTLALLQNGIQTDLVERSTVRQTPCHDTISNDYRLVTTDSERHSADVTHKHMVIPRQGDGASCYAIADNICLFGCGQKTHSRTTISQKLDILRSVKISPDRSHKPTVQNHTITVARYIYRKSNGGSCCRGAVQSAVADY